MLGRRAGGEGGHGNGSDRPARAKPSVVVLTCRRNPVPPPPFRIPLRQERPIKTNGLYLRSVEAIVPRLHGQGQFEGEPHRPMSPGFQGYFTFRVQVPSMATERGW